MTRVFVYEHVTAVGLGRESDSPHRSLFHEGRAMRDAVTADFAAVPGVEVLSFPDDLPADEHLHAFRRLASRAGWSLVIAPETGGELERFAREVVAAGGRLLGPSPEAIALTTDKLRLAEHWRVCGVPTPRTQEAPPTRPVRSAHSSDLPRQGGGTEGFRSQWDVLRIQTTFFTSPPAGEVGKPKASRVGWLPHHLVLKPRDGAGSDSTFLVSTPSEFAAALAACSGPMIAQEYVPGRAASVAFLIGPDRTVPLVPAFQLLSADGRFRYEGGAMPIEPTLAERAKAIGTKAVECVPGLFGYVGIDLILGESEDVAVEINPRLTTSYVGLRALAESNLAGVMLNVCEGKGGTLNWRPGRVRLDPTGETHRQVTISFWG